MTISIVCGTNWEDEEKGRIIDYLARDGSA